MIALLLTFLSSSGFGSILGGFMGYFNRKVDLQQKVLDLAHEKDKWAHELALREADLKQVAAEAAGKREVAVIEGDASIETARMVAISATQAADKLDPEELKQAGWWSWTLVLADAFRRFIRPGATVVLLAGAIYLNYLMIEKVLSADWAGMTIEQRYALGKDAIAWVCSQASAALSYWFVSRGSAK